MFKPKHKEAKERKRGERNKCEQMQSRLVLLELKRCMLMQVKAVPQ